MYLARNTRLPAPVAGWVDANQSRATSKSAKKILALLKDPNVNISGLDKLYQVSRTTIYKHVGPVVPTRIEADNPDLPLRFIKDTLLAVAEAKAGQLSDYQFGDQP